MKKEQKFNPNLGMNMPEFLAEKGSMYLTHADRDRIWKRIMARERKEAQM